MTHLATGVLGIQSIFQALEIRGIDRGSRAKTGIAGKQLLQGLG